MKTVYFFAIIVALLLIGLALSVINETVPCIDESFSLNPSVGLSGYVNNLNALSQMAALNFSVYRLSFNPSWTHQYHLSYSPSIIQYFLDHSNALIIVDRNHLYPPNYASTYEFISHLSDARASIDQILADFPNNSRVAVELVNEYVLPDFYSRMQAEIDYIRANGYTNPIVCNKWSSDWQILDDSLNNTYQGMHFYFNLNHASAKQEISQALSMGIKIINTEVGADSNEGFSFTQETVDELKSFLNWSKGRVINCVWMNFDLYNFNSYQKYGLF